NGVIFIGWVERYAEQCRLRDWLRRKLRVNARATKKEKFARAILVCRVNDIVLDSQILEKEFDWKVIVCLNAADLCRRENHQRWFLLGEQLRDLILEFEFRHVATDQVQDAL